MMSYVQALFGVLYEVYNSMVSVSLVVVLSISYVTGRTDYTSQMPQCSS